MELPGYKRFLIVLGSNIGLDLEFSKEDSNDDSKKANWGLIIAQMIKHYKMSISEVLNLSYPQFKALYMLIFDERAFDIVVPYLRKWRWQK